MTRVARRPGRCLMWRDVYVWVFPWGFAVKRGIVRDLWIRLWPAPYANLILYARRTQVSLSTKCGYIMRYGSIEPRVESIAGIRTMWGAWR